MITGLASVDNDLSVAVTGADIQADLSPGFGNNTPTPLAYCTLPGNIGSVIPCTNGNAANCPSDCVGAGGVYVATRFAQTLHVVLNRPAFQSAAARWRWQSHARRR